MKHPFISDVIPREVQTRKSIFTAMLEPAVILRLPGTVRLDQAGVPNVLSGRPVNQRLAGSN